MMKENKKGTILIKDFSQSGVSHQDHAKKISMETLKKPLILALMGIVFIGCMYLIFRPSKNSGQIKTVGLNDSVPQAADKEMQADKEKAYEQEMLNQKEQQKRNALLSLADYWKEDDLPEDSYTRPLDSGPSDSGPSDSGPSDSGLPDSGRRARENANPSINSYRNAQSTLGSFYQQDNGETIQLRKQLAELKAELAQKDATSPVTVDDQLVLMEKSYQMAAKYLPAQSNSNTALKVDTAADGASSNISKDVFKALTPSANNIVSSLQRKSCQKQDIENRNDSFYTAGFKQQTAQPKNSIKAYVEQTQTITEQSVVRLRLLESAEISGHTLKKGKIVTAAAKLQAGRLQLKITSIETEGIIIATDVSAYDLDGQQGLQIPYSLERTALTEMAGNMSQQSGTSITFSQSAGQQIAADLSRGAMQGIAGYFSKKVKRPKVVLKAGHQVFLVCKK